MELDGWITFGVIIMIVLALINKKKIGPDLVMSGGLVLLMLF